MISFNQGDLLRDIQLSLIEVWVSPSEMSLNFSFLKEKYNTQANVMPATTSAK